MAGKMRKTRSLFRRERILRRPSRSLPTSRATNLIAQPTNLIQGREPGSPAIQLETGNPKLETLRVALLVTLGALDGRGPAVGVFGLVAVDAEP
jgi:hypothetical protein